MRRKIPLPGWLWWLPSTCTSIPSCGIRSRRHRWREGRRYRGLGIPASINSRRTVERAKVTPSRSASNSVRWVWSNPAYRVHASIITRCRVSSEVASVGRQPRFPWASAVAPAFRYDAGIRQVWRSLSPGHKRPLPLPSAPPIPDSLFAIFLLLFVSMLVSSY